MYYLSSVHNYDTVVCCDSVKTMSYGKYSAMTKGITDCLLDQVVCLHIN